MKNYLKRLMYLLTTASLLSCVALERDDIKVPALQTKEVFLTTDYDNAWKVTASVISEYYPISILDKESGLITTESKGLPENTLSKHIVCPAIFAYLCRHYKEGRARLNVSVIEDKTKKIKIRITPHIELFHDTEKVWKIAEPYPVFYDQIVQEIYRRQPVSLE